jgi:hypothetical protein
VPASMDHQDCCRRSTRLRKVPSKLADAVVSHPSRLVISAISPPPEGLIQQSDGEDARTSPAPVIGDPDSIQATNGALSAPEGSHKRTRGRRSRKLTAISSENQSVEFDGAQQHGSAGLTQQESREPATVAPGFQQPPQTNPPALTGALLPAGFPSTSPVM